MHIQCMQHVFMLCDIAFSIYSRFRLVNAFINGPKPINGPKEVENRSNSFPVFVHSKFPECRSKMSEFIVKCTAVYGTCLQLTVTASIEYGIRVKLKL